MREESGRSRCSTAARRVWLKAALVGASGLTLWACQRQAPAFKGIDVTGAAFGRSFSLPDATGATRSLAEFKGKLVLVFFGFTQCPDVCPTALSRAVEVRRLLGQQADRLQVVFISVDPERDTPELLREYLKAFDPSFIALRGDADALAATAKEFKVIYQKVATPSSYTMDHTALSYVFDPTGRLRLALRHEQSAEDVATDLRILLRE